VLQFSRNVALICIVLYASTFNILLSAGNAGSLKNFPIAIFDLDKSEKSRDFIKRIQPPYFRIETYVYSHKEVERLILNGEVGAVLWIPKRFQDKLNRRKSADVLFIMDGTSSRIAEIAETYIHSIVQAYDVDVLVQRWHIAYNAFNNIPLVLTESRYAFNQDLTEKWSETVNDFFVMFTLIGILLPATAMVNEKQFGTIEQLMVTPVRPYEIMTAKILPMIGIFVLANLLAIYGILIPHVGVPLRGSILDFLIVCATFCFAASGIGLLVSTISNNLSETVLLALLILFPILFLSGTVVPKESLPPFMQIFVSFSPLKYYLDLGYGIFLKGNTLVEMWDKYLILAGLGCVIFWIGAMRFRKMFG
jgi:ABC-2 type transport system permease protein